MKALVLCGGIPQIALIEDLKQRGIYTILADMNPNVVARPYADEFFPVSVLDVDAVRKLAQEQHVDMVLTACADQVLLVQAQVSEELGLPCYIDYNTAKAVSSKELMKKTFLDNSIPTSKYVIMDRYNADMIRELRYPIIVKPVDSYSSRGVCKVLNETELEQAVINAIEISRTKTAIVEEYVEGSEITVDVYVEDGKAHILCASHIDKIPGSDHFVICRTRYPAQVSNSVQEKIAAVADKIAKAFHLKNSPMLIQLITNGDDISIVEFCARTGGGDKFRLIEQVSGFNVIKAVVDLTLNIKPHVDSYRSAKGIVNEFLYTKQGVLDHIEGFDDLMEKGIIKEYFQLKSKGTMCGEIKSSGDRVAYYTIQADEIEKLKEIDMEINSHIKVIDSEGKDILRHDLIANY